MRTIDILTCLTITLASCGCSVHRDASRKREYWRHIERDGIYETLKPVGGYTKHLHLLTGGDKDRWDMNLLTHTTRGPNTFTVPRGTKIQAQKVYEDSETLRYFKISYGGVIIGGAYDGKRVDFTSLLDLHMDGYHPDPTYLKKIDP